MKKVTDQRFLSIICLVVVILLSAGSVLTLASRSEAAGSSEAQGVVDNARVTFESFMRDSNMGWFHQHLKEVRGLLIVPQMLKAGFFIGGSGGTGVLVVRNHRTGDWSQPAFYTIGSVSFGAQIGGEVAEVIMMVMTEKAIDSLLASSVKLGGDTSISVGPVGIGAKENITADFVSFAKSKGLYAGLSLEGAVVDVRDSLNSAYYNADVRPTDIIITKDVSNSGSAPLRAALRRAVK